MKRHLAEPLHIGIVTDTALPFVIGGKEQRHYQIAQALTRSGIRVTVYTAQFWQGSRHTTIDDIEYVGVCKDRIRYHGSRRSIRQATGFAFGCLRLLRTPATLLDVDSIPLLPVICVAVVGKLRGRPTVMTLHEVWPNSYWTDYAGPVLGWLGVSAQWLCLRATDRVVAVSQGTADRVQKSRHHRVAVVKNGLDSELLTSVPARGPASDIMCFGHLVANKRAHLAIGAVAELRNRGRQVTLLVVGTGPEEARLRHLARTLGISHQVRWQPPWQDRRRFVSALKSTKVVLMPSGREGFGIGLLEAIALDIPAVITDDVDNLAVDLIETHDRVSVASPDAQALASALERWLDEASNAPQRYERLRRVTTWDECAMQLLAVYTELAAEGPRGHCGRTSPTSS